MVPDVFVTAHAFPLRFPAEVSSVGPERHAIGFSRLLQVFVTVQAGGVVDELLATLTNSVPVDVVGVLDQFHRRVDDAVLCLNPEVVKGIIVRQVAVVAGGPDARRVVAAVGVFPIGAGDGFISVTAGTEFIIASRVKGGIQCGPAENGSHAKHRQHCQ